MDLSRCIDLPHSPADRAWLAELLGRLEYHYRDTLDTVYPCPCCFEAAELVGSAVDGGRFCCTGCGMTFETSMRGE